MADEMRVLLADLEQDVSPALVADDLVRPIEALVSALGQNSEMGHYSCSGAQKSGKSS